MKFCSYTQGNKWRDGNLVNVELELTVNEFQYLSNFKFVALTFDSKADRTQNPLVVVDLNLKKISQSRLKPSKDTSQLEGEFSRAARYRVEQKKGS